MVQLVQFASIHIRTGGSPYGVITHRLEGEELERAIAREKRYRRNLKQIQDANPYPPGTLGGETPLDEDALDTWEIARPKPRFHDQQKMLPQWATVEVTGWDFHGRDRITFSDSSLDAVEICKDNDELRRKVKDFSRKVGRMSPEKVRQGLTEIIDLITTDALERSTNWYFGAEKSEALQADNAFAKITNRPTEDKLLDYMHTIQDAVSSEGEASRRVPLVSRALFKSPGCDAAKADRSGELPDLLK